MNHGHRPNGDLRPAVREPELHGSRVGRVRFALDQSGLLECTSEFRDEDRLQAGPLGKLALARAGTGASEAVQRGEQRVLGVGQAERGQIAVDVGAQGGGESPQQIPEGRVVDRAAHAFIQYMETIAMDTVLSTRGPTRPLGHADGGRSGAPPAPGCRKLASTTFDGGV